MLNQSYAKARKAKGKDWDALIRFCDQLNMGEVGFISMNWDCVLERRLQHVLRERLIDYGCDAEAANIPDLPDPDDYVKDSDYKKALRRPQKIAPGKPLSAEEQEKLVTLVKIHGSSNWLYCDNCRRLFWVHPDQAMRIADRLLGSLQPPLTMHNGW